MASHGNTQQEYSVSTLRMMEERAQKEILFSALRSGNVPLIKNVLQGNRNLLNAKMFGFEGADIREIVPISKTKRCYFLTGLERDGFFYPVHVAAEAGHKQLVLMLEKTGADIKFCDYLNNTPEMKANGEAIHAFYELRGLKFEELYRYQGQTDRSGKRNGQGTLYYKPEGYTAQERILYRGGFKLDQFNGRGTLYWPLSDIVQYVGRFKSGEKHGRGVEFDVAGKKVYQGTFREGKREGRGDEYEDGIRTYKGEFLNNVRHGFGIAYLAQGHRYIGRFENGAMSGVGVYSLPQGDRFEGMFYNNRQDGPGSLYKVVVSSSLPHSDDAVDPDPHAALSSSHGAGSFVIATHAIWQMGRSGKELPSRFIPKPIDMPDTRDMSQNLLHILDGSVTADVDIATHEDGDDHGIAEGTGGDSSSINFANAAKRSGSVHHDQVLSSLHTAEDEAWKLDLAKYIRIPLKDYDALGLNIPKDLKSQSFGDDDLPPDDADEEEEENEMDEILGYHFMNCAELYIAYVYVCSASKVFEGRLASKEIPEAAPDFEAVYHLVIDAVDTYNEAWETNARAQQLAAAMALEEEELRAATKDKKTSSHQPPPPPPPVSTPNSHAVESKRLMFMTEKERKEELVTRQRAELAARKGTTVLDIDVEKRISLATLQTLEHELLKLVGDAEGLVHGRGMADTDVPAATIRRNKVASYVTQQQYQMHSSVQAPAVENEFALELLHIMRTSSTFLG